MNAPGRASAAGLPAVATDDSVRATLHTWRAQGADRLDPVRFERIDALARRAAGQHGAVRRLLDARIAELVAAYATDLAHRRDGHIEPSTVPDRTVARSESALSALREHLLREALTRDGHDAAVASPTSAPSTSAAHERLEEARRTSARARTQSQLRQALERAPENAGPLNSASLVHRALSLMRDTSPDYLQPFLAYVDSLAWLEGLRPQDPSQTGSTVDAAAPARPRARKRARRG